MIEGINNEGQDLSRDQRRGIRELTMPILKEKGARGARFAMLKAISHFPDVGKEAISGFVRQCIQRIERAKSRSPVLTITEVQRDAIIDILNGNEEDNVELEIPGLKKEVRAYAKRICNIIEDESIDMRKVCKIVMKIHEAIEKRGDDSARNMMMPRISKSVLRRFKGRIPEIAQQGKRGNVLQTFKEIPRAVLDTESMRTRVMNELLGSMHPTKIVPSSIRNEVLCSGTELSNLVSLLGGLEVSISILMQRAEDDEKLREYLEKNPELERVHDILNKRTTSFPDTNYVTKKASDIHGDNEVLCGDHFIRTDKEKYIKIEEFALFSKILVDVFNELFPAKKHLRVDVSGIEPATGSKRKRRKKR
jgi:hypothetical protein